MEESLVDTSVILASQIEQLSDTNRARTDAAFGKALSDAGNRILAAEIYSYTKTNMNLRVVIVDRESKVIFDSRGERPEGGSHFWRDTRLALEGEYGARATYEVPGDPDSFHFYVAAPIVVKGKIIGAVSVGKPVSSIAPFMWQARKRLIVSGLFAFVAVLLLLIPVSLWIIRPVLTLTSYARSVRDGQQVTRPVLGHGGEMSELANAFEEMRDALEGRQYVEEYVQSLTHEMKSPLAAIQGAAELLDEEMPEEQRVRFLKNIRTESVRLHGLVDRMLALAAIEKRKELANAEILDLSNLFDDVADGLMPSFKQKSLSISMLVPEELQVYGEYFLLRQAVSNLLKNAIDFSPKGSTVELRAEVADGAVEIRVLDRGAGIPDYAIGRVFDRFYSLARPESAEKGSGLGLNFVQQIAHLHGGVAVLYNRTDGGGVEAVLSIPCS